MKKLATMCVIIGMVEARLNTLIDVFVDGFLRPKTSARKK